MGLNNKFGVGVLIATTRTDAQGNLLAVPAPYRLGILQEVSTDFSFEAKALYGDRILPVDRGRGKGKLAFSAKTAQINAAGLAALHFGVTPSVGFKGPVIDEPITVPSPSGPYTVATTPPGSGTFLNDLGIRDTNGNDFKRVASAPATGQYSVSSGTYTFAAADAGLSLLRSYEYSSSSSGLLMPLTNQLMGYAPSFGVILYNDSKGTKLVVKLTNCQSDKLSLPFKNEDFVVADFGFEAMDDGTGSAGYWSQA
ncbi:MAG: hypothetical protein SHS37scaffold296_7 [Burkholderiales phage 68_11]|jgi:hypothetical protein|nr:MAG: hypothetical protein SHS37scaffold296_7 [Burkholderiales phage 68_11]